MKKTICLKYKNKRLNLEVKICNWFEKIRGLMFCRREKAQALLFVFKKPTKIKIHSLFVFFPFIAIWFDSENKKVDSKIVKPGKWVVSSEKPFSKLIEIPINKNYSKISEFPSVIRKV